MALSDYLAEVRGWVDRALRIVALTGAGISIDSGIPDFSGPRGVLPLYPAAERASRIEHYLGDPEVRRDAWRSRLDSPAWTAEPNAGHRALVTLERRCKLDTLVTQNTDGLHQLAGSDPGKLIEIHGTMRRVVCWSCGEKAPMERALERVRAGEEDPPCRSCGGILKSDTILFGQTPLADDVERAARAAARCDLLLAVGTSLTVYPAAALVPTAADAGAVVVIVNAEPTPYDALADGVLRGPISEVLPALAGE